MPEEPSQGRPSRHFVPPEAFDELDEERVDHRSLAGPVIFIGTCLLFAAAALLLTGDLRNTDAPADPGFELATPRPVTADGAVRRSSSGRLRIDADLPEGAWIEIDGERVPAILGFGSPLRLSAGVHRVIVRAPGHHPWTAEIEIPAHTTVRIEPHLVPAATEPPPERTTLAVSTEAGERERAVTPEESSGPDPSGSGSLAGPGEPRPEPAERPARPADPPALPEALLDSLALQLEQARVLQEIERYAEAAATFRAVIHRATSAEAWPYSARLAAVKGRADSGLAAIARSCEEGRAGCE